MTLTTWAGSHTFRGGPLLRPTSVEEVYPRWDDARALVARRDPDGVFANDFLRRCGLYAEP